ncbi:MAG: hypothetical protein IIX61_08335, partial [Loktanella sp.]|nr:hypothetical protein [Loktanella sp.]
MDNTFADAIHPCPQLEGVDLTKAPKVEGKPMSYRTTLRSAVCLAALVYGGAAFADVTAQQVWDDWKTELNMFGGDLAFTAEDMVGDTLTVRGVTLSTADEGASSFVDLGDLVFTEQGDGTVRVGVADSYPVIITGADGVVVTVVVSQPDLDLIVSGNPGALDYAVNAPSLSIALQDVVGGDAAFNGEM